MSKVYIHNNRTESSIEIEKVLRVKLSARDIKVSDVPDDDTDMIITIGGDGTLLKFMQRYEFPTIPVAGINTGHLGFFQEINPNEIDRFLDRFQMDEYTVQPYSIAKANIVFRDGFEIAHRALNEFAIKNNGTSTVHLNISINNSFIERFSGDGIIVSTPAGSTAYNYSIGGALVDPRLNLLQVAPLAPMNTTAYRSLTSSILLPNNDSLIIKPYDEGSSSLQILFDGEHKVYDNIESITLTLSKRKIKLVRFSEITFWDKVKDKFL